MTLPTYRSILLRVALAALLLAVAVGTAAFLVEVEMADTRVSELAKRESAAFLSEASDALSAGAGDARAADLLHRFMTSRKDAGRAETDGIFIVAELYDATQAKSAEYVAPGAEWAEERLTANRHHFPQVGEFRYERFHLDGLFFIQTMEAMVDREGRLLGYFESVFQLSPERSGEIVKDTATVVAVSTLSVLAAALVLLPIFVAFNRGVMGLSRRLLDANIDILTVLGSAIAKRDSDTHAHNYRVTILAIRLAEAVGLEPAGIRRLVKGAFLHDVGKIAIPDRILLKPGKLDADEFTVMKTHVVHGLDILRSSAWLDDAADVVGGHHEKFDGTGYPIGLAGEAIPAVARIFAIADVFDALTSRRPYKEPMPFAQAMAILHDGAGRHFDPEMLTQFAIIAKDLHTRLTTLGDAGVEGELRRLVGHYFAAS
ncbi:HD-GYP domain-containing protein [Azospirillum sp. sgz301742]